MIALVALAVLAPLVAISSYRRGGRPWRAVTLFTVVAVLLSLFAAVVAAMYLYGIDIEAGLCGDTPRAAQAAAVAAYVVVAAWAARAPRNVWAWPCAVVAAAAVLVLVSYFFTGAHVYCET